MEASELAKIERALKGAEGRRLAEHAEAEAPPPRRIVSKASRRAAAKLLSGAGATPEVERAFAALLEADRERLQAKLAKTRAAGAKRAERAGRMLEAQRASLAASLRGLAELTTPGAERFLLTRPFMIWPTQNVDLEFSETVDLNSTAKFRVHSDSFTSGSVGFYYVWDNPRDRFAVVDANAFAIFRGDADVGQPGGNFPGSRFGSAAVEATLTILEWWNQPPTPAFGQGDHAIGILALSVSDGGFFDVGAIDHRDIHRAVDLQRRQLIVPPFGVLVFIVGAQVRLGKGEDGGNAAVDFASDGFFVGSPALIVSVVS